MVRERTTVLDVRSASRAMILAAFLAGSCGAAVAATISQGPVGAGSSGTGTSGTGTVGPATIITPGAGTTTPTGPPRGTPAEQTHPAVLPATGTARTVFTVRFTLAVAPGHVGVFATDYRLQLTAPAKTNLSRCSPATPLSNINSGTAGSVVRVALASPASGWCVGRYRLTVFLERGPYCPPPTAGQPPTPCPEFATQELDVGDTHFTITTRRHHNRTGT
jgi:hypothetical protein